MVKSIIAFIDYNVNVNKYGVKCGTSLRFWEEKKWIHPIDPNDWFQWSRSVDDRRQIAR